MKPKEMEIYITQLHNELFTALLLLFMAHKIGALIYSVVCHAERQTSLEPEMQMTVSPYMQDSIEN